MGTRAVLGVYAFFLGGDLGHSESLMSRPDEP